MGVVSGRRLAEIAGCFAFRAWARLDRPVLWLLPGAVQCLIGSAVILPPSRN